MKNPLPESAAAKHCLKPSGIRVFTILMVFMLSIQFASAQKADTTKSPTPQMSYGFYMHKHLTSRTTGWILFGSGTAVMVASLAILYSDNNWLADDSANTLGPIFLVGGAAALASIPFFIKAHSYRKKALLVIDKGSTAVGDINIHNFSYAAIGLQIQL